MTFAELLVLGLIGLFCLVLTVPWLLTARETSRRGQTQTNLRNLGTALHAYHDTWRRFPGR